MRNTNHERSAFTLIELLLVLVILGVLAAIVVPRFTGQGEKAKKDAARTGISGISTGLRMFETQCGRFPSTDEGLQALVEQPGDLKGWSGPYLETTSVPNDPWGKPYQYRYPGQHNTKGYDLWSYGPDMNDGGGDDIDNWTQQ
jgi:general secretion pathway protein G